MGEWRWCDQRIDYAGLRDRHRLVKQAARAAQREGPLREAFENLAAPERARIRAELPEAKKSHAELRGQYYGHLHFEIAHPEALLRLERLDAQIATAAWELDVQRQGLDGIAPRHPEIPQLNPGLEREPLGLERSIGIEL